MSLLRARWAAIGAAIAVSFGAGGLAAVSATAPTGASTFVPITPCRLFDTRPEAKYNKGPRKTPLKAGETWVVQVTGDNGNCKGIPAAATGVTLNLTSDYTSQLTFLTVWPDGEPRPDTSALNPVKDHPAPNEINTRLGPGGKIQIYSDQGSTDVIADITGYYIDHNHDDRYYTKTQVDAKVPAQGTVRIGSADFNPVGVGDVAVDPTAGVGAYPAAGTASNALAAGVQIPSGATITGVTVEYMDGDTTQNLSVSLRCESLGTSLDLFGGAALPDNAGKWTTATLTQNPTITPPTTTTVASTTTVAPSTTAAPTTTVAQTTTTVPAGLVPVTQSCAYQVYAMAPNWSTLASPGAIKISAVHIAYKMP